MTSARTQLGPYTLVAEIARGGMGIVYLARTPGRKLVVIKVLKPDLADDPKYQAMFLEEARLAARLKHRNIVQTEEFAESGDRSFMVMEYLEGRTLESVLRLRAERALRLPTVLRVACEVLAGLHYAHEVTDQDGAPLGLVHRDVSPHNVFITYDGHVKVLDFGVAKAFGRQQTDPGVLRGRVSCMAPDHLRDAPLDRRADVFSVGVMIREALTGKRLWSGTEVEILRELMAGRIPPLEGEATGPKIPAEVRSIVEKAMSPERDQRFRTAHAMRAAIEQYVIRVDPSGSLTEVGALVAREFADHRAHAAAVIEQHLSGSDESLAMGLDPPLLPLSSSVLPFASKPSRAPGEGGVSSGSVAIAPLGAPPTGLLDARPEFDPSDDEPTSALPSSREVSAAPPLDLLVDTPGSAPAPAPAPLAPTSSAEVSVEALAGTAHVSSESRRGLPVLGGAALAVLMAAIGLLFYTRFTHSSASTGSGAEAVAAAAASDQIPLFIKATPANAQLVVDDIVTPANPWRASFPRGTTHTVRAVAAGHTARSETVTLNATTHLSIDLEPAANEAASEAPAPPPVAAAPAAEGRGKSAPPRAAAPPPRPAPPATPARAPARVGGPAPRAAAQPGPAAAPVAAPPAAASAVPASADVFGGGKAPSRSIEAKTPYQ